MPARILNDPSNIHSKKFFFSFRSSSSSFSSSSSSLGFFQKFGNLAPFQLCWALRSLQDSFKDARHPSAQLETELSQPLNRNGCLSVHRIGFRSEHQSRASMRILKNPAGSGYSEIEHRKPIRCHVTNLANPTRLFIPFDSSSSAHKIEIN